MERLRNILPRRRGPKRSRARIALLIAGVTFAVGLLGFVVLYALSDIPDPDQVGTAQAVTVLDHTGERLGRMSGSEDRVSIGLDQMPEHLRNAVIAVEDRTFHSHSGVAPLSILRATFRNVVARDAVEGGSTITQQYVKNAFVGNDRTLWRKFREAVLAVKLERSWTKDEILEAYLNTIYLGRGAYGVEAASREYFRHGAEGLTLAESALIAGIIRAPETYEPSREPDLARERRDLVLALMRDQGMVTAEQAERAMRARLKVAPRRVGGLAPHLFEEVRAELEQSLGPDVLYAGGVTVTVTLDEQMQRAALRAVRSVYDRRSDPEVSLVAIDPADGSVRAMIGSRDFSRLQFNLAMRARRQSGSAFKPAVLVAGLEDDMSPRTTFSAPGTITIDTDSGPWQVSNYDRAGRGRLTVARATELSVNTVYAQMIDRIGPAEVAELAARMGISSELDPVHSLALGTSGTTTLELASMYATLAARGEWNEPTLIVSVTDASGEVIYAPEPAREQALDRRTADTATAVLEGVILRGTGTGAQIGRPAAGKTGTTENFRDALFAGYTPDLAAVVWNGYPKKKTLEGVRGINVVGGSFPARIWSSFMRAALADTPPTAFVDPIGEPSPSPSPTRRPSRDPEPTATPSVTPTSSPSPSPSPSASPSPSPSPSDEPTPTPTASEAPGSDRDARARAP